MRRGFRPQLFLTSVLRLPPAPCGPYAQSRSPSGSPRRLGRGAGPKSSPPAGRGLGWLYRGELGVRKALRSKALGPRDTLAPVEPSQGRGEPRVSVRESRAVGAEAIPVCTKAQPAVAPQGTHCSGGVGAVQGRSRNPRNDCPSNTSVNADPPQRDQRPAWLPCAAPPRHRRHLEALLGGTPFFGFPSAAVFYRRRRRRRPRRPSRRGRRRRPRGPRPPRGSPSVPHD